MHTTKVIKNFTETELQKGIDQNASWHQDYKDSAYVYVGGLHYEMNEGDVSTVFSQYGELVDVRLMRDKKTGKSRGFAFVAYEDQRSTILAVDNFNGAEVCGRTIRVDHVKKFKPPKEFLEVKEGEEGDDVPDEEKIYKPSGPDGRGWGQYRDYTEEELELMKLEEQRVEKTKDQMDTLYEKMEETRKKVIIDEDERWESMLMSRVEAEEDQREKVRKEFEKKIRKEKKRRMKMEKKLEKKEKKEKKKKEKKEKTGEEEGNEDFELQKREAEDVDIKSLSKPVEDKEKERKHKRESRSKSADRNKERENKHKEKKKVNRKDKSSSRSRSRSRSDSSESSGKGRQRHDTSSERD